MALKLQWTGRNELDRVAKIRWQCYGSRTGELPSFSERSGTGRFEDGDVCIASDQGVDVGTATALSLQMHIRGKRIACQGVAWVGTSKSHRRRAAGEKGVASQVMEAILNKARGRQQLASALMPFRVSFYEHFGYGLVERHQVWTFPISIIPADNSANWRFGTEKDKSAMLACRERQVVNGHCDIETSTAAMNEWFASLLPDCQLFVDEREGKITAYCWIKTIVENDRMIAQIVQPAWEDMDGLRSVLSLLASFRDQYSAGRISLPSDLPVNWLFRERQIPHRVVEHPASSLKVISRMQVRVMDHVGFMQDQELVRPLKKTVTLNIRESEGTTSRFSLDFGGDKIHAALSNRDADVETTDVVWSSIACGELRASTARDLGLIASNDPEVLAALDLLAEGPAPFCYEYF